MRIENTSEAQRHLTVSADKVPPPDNHVIVPGKREGVNGSAEVSKEFVAELKANKDDAAYFTSGVLVVVDGPKVAAPVKTDDEKAAANVAAVLDRHEHDRQEHDKAKEKHKK